MLVRLVLLGLCLIGLSDAAGEAAPLGSGSCQLKQLASIETYLTSDALLMRATMNGIPKYLVIDSDFGSNTLDQRAATELGLNVTPWRPWVIDILETPRASDQVARVNEFAFGGFAPQKAQFFVTPSYFRYSKDVAGALAPSFRNFDVEFDFSSSRIVLFAPSSCIEGPHWSNAGAAAIDLEAHRFETIRFPVLLDGKRVIAALSTDRAASSIRDQTAQALFGIGSDEQLSVLRTLTTEKGEIAINNPHFRLVPSYSNSFQVQPDVYIGLDVLKHLRIYVAENRHKIFLTAASGPPKIALELPALPRTR